MDVETTLPTEVRTNSFGRKYLCAVTEKKNPKTGQRDFVKWLEWADEPVFHAYDSISMGQLVNVINKAKIDTDKKKKNPLNKESELDLFVKNLIFRIRILYENISFNKK